MILKIHISYKYYFDICVLFTSRSLSKDSMNFFVYFMDHNQQGKKRWWGDLIVPSLLLRTNDGNEEEWDDKKRLQILNLGVYKN